MPVKPLHQGDLDGLCGVYAALNVTQLLVPQARDWDYLEKLFVHIVGGIYKARDVTAGGEISKMLAVLDYAREHVRKNFKINMTASNNRPHHDYKSPFDEIKAAFDTGVSGAYIMGYEGRDSHWTVVKGMTTSKEEILLFDSCWQLGFEAKDLVWSKGAKNPKKTQKIIVQPCDLVWVSADSIK